MTFFSHLKKAAIATAFVLGALIIIFLIAEPNGLSALFDRLKRRFGSRSS